MPRSQLLILALGTFALGTDVFVIAGVLPDVAQGIRVSLSSAGFLVTVFALTYAIGSPVLASITGSIPRKLLLTSALAIFSLANLLAALAPNYLWLLIARILAGVTAAIYTPQASAVGASLVSPNLRGRALATVLTGFSAAIVLGVPIGTIIGTLFSWRLTFGFLAMLGGIAAIGIFIALPKSSTPEPLRLRERIEVIRRPRVSKMLLLTILWTIGSFTVYTYIIPVLRHSVGLSGWETSGILLWYGLMAMLGNHIGGIGVDRWGAQKTLTPALGLVALVLLTLHWTITTLPETLAALGLWALSGWILQAPQQHRLLELGPRAPSVILAWNGSAIYVGMAGGAALGGYLIHHATITWLGYVGGGCEATALLLHTLWSRTGGLIPKASAVTASTPAKNLSKNCPRSGEEIRLDNPTLNCNNCSSR